jgi:hypothetical protein
MPDPGTVIFFVVLMIVLMPIAIWLDSPERPWHRRRGP